ncbi:Glycosyl transferase family 2 [Paenibacillus naphthalenovorans]|nr:Glycosyl transferase family 2 [Paenibacillus naphthalenovorans]
MMKQTTANKPKSKRPVKTFFHNSEAPKVSVIIPVMNEIKTLGHVIRAASRVHSKTEVIVVANGSTDGSEELAELSGTRVISFKQPLGHDVGRAIGAMEAKGDILVFTDGDIKVSTSMLTPLVAAIKNGADIALNNHSGPIYKKEVHSVVLAKYALNVMLSRSDLKGASMTTIPHAMARKALAMIGAGALAVPPLAMAIAVQKGLKIRRVNRVPVGKMNRKRNRIKNGFDPLAELIIGDHLEAMERVIQATDARGGIPDLPNKRHLVR